MAESVYVDLFFMINFSMDFLCFFLSAKLLGREFSLRRTVIGSVIGGIYADIALFINISSLGALIIDICVCAIMCFVVFYRKDEMKRMLIYILVYTAISMLLGGVMTAIFNMLNRSELFSGIQNNDGDGISVWLFAALAIISGMITLFGGRFFTRRISCRSIDIEISYSGKSVRIRAMSDSGNLLCDPISGKACVVVDIGAISSILPYRVARAAKAGDISGIEDIASIDSKNIRLIPTHTATGDSVLIGLRVEKITVCTDKMKKDIDAMIALANIGIRADGHQALIPSTLLI